MDSSEVEQYADVLKRYRPQIEAYFEKLDGESGKTMASKKLTKPIMRRDSKVPVEPTKKPGKAFGTGLIAIAAAIGAMLLFRKGKRSGATV
jgi:hypothetical protein